MGPSFPPRRRVKLPTSLFHVSDDDSPACVCRTDRYDASPERGDRIGFSGVHIHSSRAPHRRDHVFPTASAAVQLEMANSFVTMEANETGTAEIWASVGAALRISGKFVAASAQNKDSRGVGGGVGGGTGLPAAVSLFV